MGDEVKLVDGKFVKTGKKKDEGGERERRYIYPWNQFNALLNIAKSDGLDVGETTGTKTSAVRTMSGLILDAFIADRAKSK